MIDIVEKQQIFADMVSGKPWLVPVILVDIGSAWQYILHPFSLCDTAFADDGLRGVGMQGQTQEPISS